MNEDDILIKIERDMETRHQRLRLFLLEQNRADLLAEYDANIRDVRLGLSSARGIWHALSKAQRGLLEALGAGFYPRAREATLENLIRRQLISVTNGRMSITEHGRFVLKHGEPTK